MWKKRGQSTRRLLREQSGQSLIIVAVASLGVLLFAGLAIDLGQVYVERIRLGRACDAAALAAAQELPYQVKAELRAIDYLEKNGYGPLARDPEDASKWSGPRGTFTLTTFSSGTIVGVEVIDRIEVAGQVQVPLTLMLVANLFGFNFSTVPVSAGATAETVNKLDIAIIYDASASMNDDTYCHTCFNTENRDVNPLPECYGCYLGSPDEEYPAGQRLALPLPHEYCGAQRPLDYDGYTLLVAEAEWFADTTSLAGREHDYRRAEYEPGTTFWMLQRVKGSHASGHSFDYEIDEEACLQKDPDETVADYRGAHMMHLPWLYDIAGHPTTADAPRLDYRFDIPTSGTWSLWIRAQCGPWPGGSEHVDGCLVHWGVDGDRMGGSDRAQFGQGIARCYVGTDRVPCYPPREGGARGNLWKWIKLGSFASGSGEREINLWGGGTGFRVDKVVLTNSPEGPGHGADRAPEFIRETTPNWDDVRCHSYQTYWKDENGNGRQDPNEPSGGPPDTGGRGGLACDSCNPIYGLRVPENPDEGEPIVCDNTQDDILDDAQPVRAAQEAAKDFVRRLRARVDQVGFVEYKNSATILRELNCAARPGMPEGLGVWDSETGPDPAWTWCFDHRTGSGGYQGAQDTSVRGGSIIGGIESMQLGSGGNVWTNIADGIVKGMEVLSEEGGHNGRPQFSTLKIMILMTDGVPNRWPGNKCHQEDLWPDNTGDTNIDRAKDCVIYYAQEAQASNIPIFTVGLGLAVDDALLQEVADITDGAYFQAKTAGELGEKLQEIADLIFLRLVG